jgi:hypothetical protein
MREVKLSDCRETPDWLYKGLFSDWFDPCPIARVPQIDGLLIDWKDKTYVNPPYSDPSMWVSKAIEENKKGKTIVLLLKFDSTTKWFRDLIDAKAHYFFSGERLKFHNPYIKTNTISPFTSVLFVLYGGGE